VASLLPAAAKLPAGAVVQVLALVNFPAGHAAGAPVVPPVVPPPVGKPLVGFGVGWGVGLGVGWGVGVGVGVGVVATFVGVAINLAKGADCEGAVAPTPAPMLKMLHQP